MGGDSDTDDGELDKLGTFGSSGKPKPPRYLPTPFSASDTRSPLPPLGPFAPGPNSLVFVFDTILSHLRFSTNSSDSCCSNWVRSSRHLDSLAAINRSKSACFSANVRTVGVWDPDCVISGVLAGMSKRLEEEGEDEFGRERAGRPAALVDTPLGNSGMDPKDGAEGDTEYEIDDSRFGLGLRPALIAFRVLVELERVREAVGLATGGDTTACPLLPSCSGLGPDERVSGLKLDDAAAGVVGVAREDVAIFCSLFGES